MRADARRNRQRLVESARAELELAVEGAQISGGRAGGLSLDAVARRAQVGPGTLYRHFPSRETLIEAVYQDELHKLCAAADSLLRESPSPDVALMAWMSKYADFVDTKRGMSEVLRGGDGAHPLGVTDTRAQLAGAVGTVIDAGVREGVFRSDVSPTDVVAAMAGALLAAVGDPPRAQTDRLLALVVDGLRLGPRQT